MPAFLREVLALAGRAGRPGRPDRLRRLARLGKAAARVAAGSFLDGRPLSGPLFVQLSVANPCNQRCLFCRIQHDQSLLPEAERGRFLPLATFRPLIASLGAMGAQLATFTGAGEPSLHPDLPEMVALAREAGLLVSMNTNGLMPRKRALALAEAGLDRVNVSLNAATPAMHALVSGHADERPFARILENLEAWRESGISLRLSFVINAVNRHEIAEFAALAARLGTDMTRYIPAVGLEAVETMRPMLLGARAIPEAARQLRQAQALLQRAGRRANADDVARLLEQGAFQTGQAGGKARIYERLSCFAGWYFASVGAEGTVHSCCGAASSMGELPHDSFEAIWRSPRYADFRRRYRENPLAAMRSGEYRTACDDCQFIQYNLAFQRLTRPWRSGGRPA